MDDALTPQNVELSDIHDRPELITSLLYQKLLEKLDAAIMLLPQRRYLEANRAMQYCNEILTRLGFGIKYEAGVIADQLEMLYKYMFDRIHEANMKKDIEILREVRRLVRDLNRVWLIAIDNAKNAGEGSASKSGVSKVANSVGSGRSGGIRFNPYQQREMEQEVYQYQQQNQEIHLKK